MSLPGFTAEESLYQTSNHYRFAVGGSFLSDGKTTVTPQACRWYFEGPICGAAVAGATVLCVEACTFGGPVVCYSCWAGALAIVGFGFCRDCIPASIRAILDSVDGGGGGGSGPRCARAGESCVNRTCCSGLQCSPNGICVGGDVRPF